MTFIPDCLWTGRCVTALQWRMTQQITYNCWCTPPSLSVETYRTTRESSLKELAFRSLCSSFLSQYIVLHSTHCFVSLCKFYFQLPEDFYTCCMKRILLYFQCCRMFGRNNVTDITYDTTHVYLLPNLFPSHAAKSAIIVHRCFFVPHIG